jgi:hypothetical protein
MDYRAGLGELHGFGARWWMRRCAIEAGSIVIATFINPRERIWGQLLAVGPEGVTLCGISLESFDDFLRQALHEADTNVTMTTAFYPMHRVERIAYDEPAGGVPSLSDRFIAKVGVTLGEYLRLGKVRP